MTTRLFIILPALFLIVLGGWYVYSRHATFPPRENACYDLAQESLDTLRSRGDVIVPTLTTIRISHVRCGVVPGFIHFEIDGTDAHGALIRLFETSGGKAASGADTILDYCYKKDGAVVSGIKMTGREGIRAEPGCAYDDQYLKDATETYSYDIGILTLYSH